ncbi:MAG: PIN domain nuclease [Deltaproteobacteria bacterium]|nr:PIN domain nuclease [Deltaproteobacteria bacterium]
MTNELIIADTTVWIHFLRGSGVQFRERLVPLIMADKLATTPIVIMEILRGARSQKEYDKLGKDLAALRCFDLSVKVWERASKLGYTLRHKGLNVPLTDTLFAAVAQEYNACLLHDDRHFEMIASISPLKHEVLRA